MSTAAGPRARRTHSVKDLLARQPAGLTRIADQANRQEFWRLWLTQRLPGPMSEQISGIAELDGRLTVFAASAAWSARLRFALLALESELRAAAPAVKTIEVRVLPRG